MTTFVHEVSFVAAGNGHAFDFKNLSTILWNAFELDKDFGFSRKPTVDYFFSLNSDVAQRMLVGKDKKNKALLVPSAVDIGKISLRRMGATTFVTVEEKVKNLKTRMAISNEKGLISIGSRTGDFWYTVTTNAANECVETLQIRPPYATKVRELLVNDNDVDVIFDALLEEVLGLGIYTFPTTFGFTSEPTRKAKASETDKQALSLARRVYNYWATENIDILEEVCSKARPILDKMIEDELLRRHGEAIKGEQGEQGQPGQPVEPEIEQQPDNDVGQTLTE